ncbi:hypothetical protein E3N88_19647 [Mikania micrantha]|uniref:Uncharacterized protein n=1 Tax=Mikania micrantha TaxID=192012 RepID=A0A5N6NP15_9ASTR|nr:hypothetical protein E3N88_19647 [Mikania micrantha]
MVVMRRREDLRKEMRWIKGMADNWVMDPIGLLDKKTSIGLMKKKRGDEKGIAVLGFSTFPSGDLGILHRLILSQFHLPIGANLYHCSVVGIESSRPFEFAVVTVVQSSKSKSSIMEAINTVTPIKAICRLSILNLHESIETQSSRFTIHLRQRIIRSSSPIRDRDSSVDVRLTEVRTVRLTAEICSSHVSKFILHERHDSRTNCLQFAKDMRF